MVSVRPVSLWSRFVLVQPLRKGLDGGGIPSFGFARFLGGFARSVDRVVR